MLSWEKWDFLEAVSVSDFYRYLPLRATISAIYRTTYKSWPEPFCKTITKLISNLTGFNIWTLRPISRLHASRILEKEPQTLSIIIQYFIIRNAISRHKKRPLRIKSSRETPVDSRRAWKLAEDNKMNRIRQNQRTINCVLYTEKKKSTERPRRRKEIDCNGTSFVAMETKDEEQWEVQSDDDEINIFCYNMGNNKKIYIN